MKSVLNSLPQSLNICRRELSETGYLGWQRVTFTDLRSLGCQKKLKILDISYSEIESLHTLMSQPSMIKIVADNSKIANFAGLSCQPRLRDISFINTPLSQSDNFRLAAIVCIGPRLSVINNIPVSKQERRIAEAYPPISRYLIEAGWILQYPLPSPHDFIYLANKFGINAQSSDFEAKAHPPSDINALHIAKLPDNEISTSLSHKLASILRPLGFPIQNGKEMNEDILKSVETICSTIQLIENQS